MLLLLGGGLGCALLMGPGSCSSAEVLFSADRVDGAPLHERVAGEIDAATESVHVAIFTITDSEETPHIIDALIAAGARGLDVRVCADAEQAPTNAEAIARLASGGVEVGQRGGHGGGIMHHKFVVIDGRVVLTGSFNFTRSAELLNDENLLRLVDPALAAAYEAEFERLAQGCF